MKNKKKKILVIGMTNILGGVETFIRNTYLNFDYEEFDVDFLHHSETGILFEEEFKKNNSKIFFCNKFLSNPAKSYKELKHMYVREKYDIIHCNACSANMLIYFLPVLFFKEKPLIVMHSHNGSSDKKLRHYLFRIILNKIVDVKYACSEVAGEWMYGKKSNYEIIPNGIDTKKFLFNEEVRNKMRKQLNIKKTDVVLGSVGRLETVKNHEFIINCMAELNDNYKYIVIGEGSLKSHLKKIISEKNLNKRVSILDNVSDIYNYFQMFDIFVMPSIFEGMPMVCIEAQTSGLPLILSDKISKDTKLNDNVAFLSLNDKETWINKIKSINIKEINRKDCNKEIIEKFDCRKVARKIENRFKKN